MRDNAVRAVFSDPEAGYIAIYQLRKAGFRVDVAATMSGDVAVTVEAGDRIDELTKLVSDAEGRLESA